jgi:SAM-dependent methyltransferase
MPDQDLLADSAPIARAYAEDHCWHAPGSSERCNWYHGLWQYLRLLEIVSSPEIHSRFFAETLGKLAESGDFKRILIAGTADYAMLEYVVEAYQDHIDSAAITVSDRCPTPLHLCEWYAARRSISIHTQACEAVGLKFQTPFDLLCNHCFLSNISADQRPALLRTWHGLLRPGGLVVTINRIRPAGGQDNAAFSKSQAADFVARAEKAARERRYTIDLPAQTLASMTADYARRIAFDPIRSTDELRQLFESNGFRLEILEPFESDARQQATPSGPTTPSGALYLKIVASRI